MPKEQYTAEFKAKLALAALCEDKTVEELSMEFDVPQAFIYKWVKQLKDSAINIFSDEFEIKGTMIGQLTEKERDFLFKAFAKQ